MITTIAIAGSTHNTVRCAQSLLDSNNFKISAIITPAPKLIGRKQVLTENPLHQFAKVHNIPVILVEKKLDEGVKKSVLETVRPDILLVVDFGYLIPSWCLQWPTIAPVNIHPSDLPKYRGSSPGQFTLLFGEKGSAVSIIVMDKDLDHGPILAQIPFEVDEQWTQKEYYDHAFTITKQKLPEILTAFIKNPTEVTPQPDESSTPIARQLTREDGHIHFSTLSSLLSGSEISVSVPFLSSYALHTNVATIFNMFRALTPWPGIWTEVMINGETKRMKILKLSRTKDSIEIDTVQIEGKTAQAFNEVKKLISK